MKTIPRTPRRLRRLKIGYHSYAQRRDGEWAPSRAVPYLRLSGDWLAQAGFPVGATVCARIDPGCITLQLEPTA